jgi:hypothetical protein
MRLGMANKRKQSTSALTLETIIAQTAPAAFDAVRAEIEAVPVEALRSINLDIPRAARRGVVVADRIKPLLPAMATLPDLDFRAVQNLNLYGLALLHTHDLATEPTKDLAPLAELLAEATPLRENMLCTAEVLVRFGLFSGERVAAIRSGQGHADTADDLQTLGRLFGESWDRVHDKVAVTREDVDRSITLSAALQMALGVRELDDDPLTTPSDARHLRAQAFTLFTRAYKECRRGVSYLRFHHGDAHRIVPSLYPRHYPKPKQDAEGYDAADELLDPSREEEPEDELVPPPATSPVSDMTADSHVDG